LILTELNNLKAQLTAAINNGQLTLNGTTTVLDFSMDVIVKKNNSASTAEKVSKTVIMVAALVAAGALLGGVFLTFSKYAKTQKKVKAHKKYEVPGVNPKKEIPADEAEDRDFMDFSGSELRSPANGNQASSSNLNVVDTNRNIISPKSETNTNVVPLASAANVDQKSGDIIVEPKEEVNLKPQEKNESDPSAFQMLSPNNESGKLELSESHDVGESESIAVNNDPGKL
jgi:hypothetical protein